MARNPNPKVTFSYRDRSREKTGWSIPVATDIDTVDELAAATALVTATHAVIDGLHTKTTFNRSTKITNAIQATAGQREEKWLVTYQDNVTLNPYQLELPCRKASVAPPAGSDFVDLTVAPWPAYKTAIENPTFVSPDGNPITLMSVELMGKNI